MIPLLILMQITVEPVLCGKYSDFLQDSEVAIKSIEMTVGKYRFEEWLSKTIKATVRVRPEDNWMCFVKVEPRYEDE